MLASATSEARICRYSAGELACQPPDSNAANAASLALWHFVVQREACGLRDLRYVLRDYRVPHEVYARMGAIAGESLPVLRLQR